MLLWASPSALLIQPYLPASSIPSYGKIVCVYGQDFSLDILQTFVSDLAETLYCRMLLSCNLITKRNKELSASRSALRNTIRNTGLHPI